MKLPLQIVFRNIDPSEAVKDDVRERTQALENIYDGIVSCHVVIEQRHQRHQQGNLFQVSVDIKVPNDELVANRSPGDHHAHEDVYVAIRDTFDAVERQLEHYVRRRQEKSYAQ